MKNNSEQSEIHGTGLKLFRIHNHLLSLAEAKSKRDWDTAYDKLAELWIELRHHMQPDTHKIIATKWKDVTLLYERHSRGANVPEMYGKVIDLQTDFMGVYKAAGLDTLNRQEKKKLSRTIFE